ncbi:MAG: AMP-binding protein [Chloroflexi bacterium]|nr:AMP-binding protein [Chloroflexota bacterium]
MAQALTYLDRPWLKSYKLGPYKLETSLAPYPKEPVFAVLDKAAENYPTQTAILYLGRSIQYRELRGQVDRLAAALSKLGVQKGDRVCLFLPNCPEFILGDWAILKAGAAVVPTSILRSDEGLLHEVGSSNAKIVICREDMLERVLAAREKSSIEQIIVTSCDGYDVADVAGPLPRGVHKLRKLLAENEAVPPQVDIDPEVDLCELAFTGGATGIPKGVMVTHYNRYSCIHLGFPWALKPLNRGFVGKASLFIALPMFHAMGHYAHQAGAHLGLRIILLPDPRNTEMIVNYLKEYRPFIVPAVPTQFMRIAQADLGRMNALLLSGAAPLPLEVSEAIKKKTGMPISQAYGLTETSPLTHLNLSAFAKITGFMAKEKAGIGVPTPDTECRLVHPETGQDVPFGQPGEMLVRGPQIMRGYWPTPGSGLDAEGWLHTGDIAVMDEEGYFQLVDRVKDMANISGMKVYTIQVDEVLFRHPAVLMAAAIGVPDPEIPGSERIMAFVTLKEPYKGRVSAEEIKNFCRQHLAPYAVPTFVEFRDALPLTVSEKVFKKALRDEIIAQMKVGGDQ